MKYYKIVRTRAGRLLSSTAEGEAQVEYIPHEWVKPRIANSKLFVFNDIGEACWFFVAGEEVWECEVENPGKMEYMWIYNKEEQFEAFWAGTLSDRASLVPVSTFGCDAVKLTRKLSQREIDEGRKL